MEETEKIERVAKAIARTIPLDGSRWVAGHGDDFPREYSEAEQRLVRGIARDAIRAIDAALSSSTRGE